MSARTIEQRAISLVRTFEASGKSVSGIAVEGRRIEVMLASGERFDEFDRIDMRHGKT